MTTTDRETVQRYSIKTAASRMDCSPDLMLVAINRRELPAYRIGRKIVVRADDLDTWANRHQYHDL